MYEDLWTNPAKYELTEATQSSMGTFMACQQKFIFTYWMRLQGKGESMALRVGEAFHKGLEVLLNPDDETPIDDRMPEVRKVIDEVFDKLSERSDLLDSGALSNLDTHRATAHACVEAWFIIHCDLVRDEWEIIASEQVFRSTRNPTIPNSTALSQRLEDNMAGKIDNLVRYQGEDWLAEHKALSFLTLRIIDINNLELNMQAMYYLLATLVLKQFEKFHLKGFLYNIVLKPQHKMTSAGFENLKQRMIHAMVSDPDKYFIMQPIEVDVETIKRHYRNFKRIYSDMRSITVDSVYMNTNSCNDYGGCPFRTLCMNGADASKPAEVMLMPQIENFTVRGGDIHQELVAKET